ncbi:rhodanese-related sulfurtransferase [Porifericola rhodea]|uniref:oxygen-dependent tRNA uridine(34) hydroxylase TrhO n=1 Tax=Porifericola rhodea TaxID=930972 RepID=UPI0026669CFE|nr:rhodanese-related sulfurtransferase [Porifericola rhodea]WKN31285.1 rhodanese-related sulfurtransferase [Porifericola rhodea]
MLLHNRVDKRILKQQMEESEEKRTTLSFYNYARIDDPNTTRDQLYLDWSKFNVLGRVYLAQEGINAQINVPEDKFEAFKAYLNEVPFLKGVRLNIAVEKDKKSFYKLKIKVRTKIVADGLEDDSFDVSDRGKHVNAEEFNRLTDDPNTIVVDMRNHYESEVGHFENAILPDVDTFRDALPIVNETLQPYRDRNIIMYCTGGIRCEKASAYFKHLGFKNVHQLEGGIIKYAHEVKEKGLPNKFKGKNFVFDERLGERISDEVISHCHQCGKACDTHTNCRNDACHLLFIQCDECAKKYDNCCSNECKTFVNLPEEDQKTLRKQYQQKRNVFRKGRVDQLENHWLKDAPLIKNQAHD